MKVGRSLQEVLMELQRQNQAKKDYIAPAQSMRLEKDGRTFQMGEQAPFATTQLFHRQLASTLAIPAKYYDLMQKEKPELLAENVNSWFQREPVDGLWRRPCGESTSLGKIQKDRQHGDRLCGAAAVCR